MPSSASSFLPSMNQPDAMLVKLTVLSRMGPAHARHAAFGVTVELASCHIVVAGLRYGIASTAP
jgi:hypothetical protein